MSKKEDFGSEYLYAENLLSGGKFVSVTCEIEEVIAPNMLKAANGKMIDKPTLKFRGKDRMLVLCKTNVSVLHYVCGGGPAEWPGKKITLAVRQIEAFGEQVVAVRVMPEGIKIRKGLVKRLGIPATLAKEQQAG